MYDSGALLSDMNIPHLELVLDEIFGIPPARLLLEIKPPTTVLELARATRLAPAEVAMRLERIRLMSIGIEIACAELQGLLNGSSDHERPILVDVREFWEFEQCHLPGSLLLANENFQELLPKLRAATDVITICHHGMRSYSAAMYLKQQGVEKVRSLAGGVDAWARSVDPTMKRY